MFNSCSFLFFLIFLAGSSLAKDVNYQLITNNAFVSPDGFNRSGVLANGTFPGPLIKAQKGDRLLINVTNDITDSSMLEPTSIHWHGLFQHRHAEADGPAFVTQCPIIPNHSFLYNMPLENQTGTFWYHSHLSTQYCDGLRGPLVIYDPEDPQQYLYDVDDESTIITLADWYHDPAPQLTDTYLQTAVVPLPDSGLINGVGRFVNGSQEPFAIVNVQAGKRYRLRVINIGCRPFHTFSIDGHKLNVIEADGIAHDAVEVDQFDIYAAQRYSAVLTANQPVGNYWIRAPLTGGGGNIDQSLIKAILRYAGAPSEDPTTTGLTNPRNLTDADLHPLINPGSPGGNVTADKYVILELSMPNKPFFEVNGSSFQSPTLPALLQILSGASKPEDFLPSENMILLPPNSLIEVTIPGDGAHPFHLHGHVFDIVRSSNSNYTNYVNPPRRDVVPINGGETTFRFRTGNPGPWFLHCHIDWHLEVGLAVIMGEAVNETVHGPQSQIISPDWKELCPIYYASPFGQKGNGTA